MGMIKFSKLIIPIMLVVSMVLAIACSSEAALTPERQAPAAYPTAVPAAAIVPTATAVTTAPIVPVASTAGPKYGGTLRFAHHLDYDVLDPAYQLLVPSRRVMYTIYSSLVQMNPDSSIGPELARSWEVSADGKEIIFKLAEGAKFHDGTPADASAVKYNFDRFMDPAVGSPRGKDLAPSLSAIEVIDSTTIRMVLKKAFRPIMQLLSIRTGQIASPTALEATNSYDDRNGDFGANPVGAGMFKFKEWLPAQRIVLERNKDYFEEGLPYLDEIRFLQIPDNRVIFAMLRTGEIEAQENIVPGDYEIAKRNPRIKIIRQDGARGRAIYFKTNVAPWDSKALRQAFAMAMDRQTLVDVVYEGLAEKAYSPIYSSFGVYYDPSFDLLKYDPEGARAKLAEAGYPNGFKYNQPCRAASFEMEYCEIAQAMFKKSGIDMQIQPWDNRTYFSDWVAGKYDEGTWAGYRARIDPDVMLRSFLHSDGSRNTMSRTAYRNPAFDAILDEAVGVYDASKAASLYKKALNIMVPDAPIVVQVAETLLYGLNVDVRNFQTRPDAETRVRDLWLDR